MDPQRSHDTQQEDWSNALASTQKSLPQLRNQRSAPDLKQKRKVAHKTDVNVVSRLESLGAGSGLGLSSTARPIGSRRQTDPPVDANAVTRKPRMSFSRGSRAKEKTSDVSPATSGGLASPDPSYFSPSQTSSPRVVTPGSGRATPQLTTSVRPLNKNLARNPAFTSHPPNMIMASSPPERHTEDIQRSDTPAKVPALQAVPDLDSKHASIESSLGEPGPEISAADSLIDVDEAPAIAELDSGSPARPAPVELEGTVPQASQPILFELEAPRQPSSVAPNTAARLMPVSPISGTIRSQSDFYKLPPQQAGEREEDQSDTVALMVPGQSRSRSGTENAALHHRSFQLPPAALPDNLKIPTN